MFIGGLSNADSLPVVQRAMQFAARRHELIADSVANFDTPHYQHRDVSVESFQEGLREAIRERREAYGASGGALHLRDTTEVEVHADRLELKPSTGSGNILFHDGNDRDLERTMADMVKNFSMFRAMAQFMQSHYRMIDTAIAGRV